ncbi:glycosyltransferase [Jannaschia seohaensis]|uniref:GT2 family glycosyltransferase n=1 Tax=Jannaschia seohaensis TaxID=475081 RepID=A0A2Y9B2M6_9RHOB|nr:glycosyltransferase [Jannaschia seohaensis]PWJ12908.1 GT2 family glycosyltransferase [Jannaschia seohaensis]SSA50716.1 Glycosyltransferase, GT2 family [Jannaschia seohaensis]
MIVYLRRLEGLFQRFDRARPGIPALNARARLQGADGRDVARLERALHERRRLAVSGQSEAPWVELRVGERRTRIERPAGALGPVPFALALPLEDGEAPEAAVSAGGAPVRLRFPPRWRVQTMRGADFAWRMLRLVPALVGWALTHDPRHRGTVKRMLDLEGGDRFGPLPHDLFAPAPPDADLPPPTVILPAHDGHDLLVACLDRLARHTTGPWRLIAVEDRSTDPRIRPLLEARLPELGAAETHLIAPAENLGFVGAVNAALEAREAKGWDGPVILLNSDALVPRDWLPRLLAPLADPSVASVTPLSNDAEITTVPTICMRHDLPPGAVDRIDAALAALGPATAEMPTGVGFCMALSGAHLAQVPRLDPAFGPGYGEEVDWCQKVRALGGRHLGLGRLFVEHAGGVSFGSETKRRLIQRNHRTIVARYPAYEGEVNVFLEDDPLRGPRLAGALAWAGAVAPEGVPVYLAHWLGGGAEIWLQRRIARDLGRGRPSAVIRVGGTARWQVELHAPTGVTGATTEDAGTVAALLALLPRRDLVYHCGVGDPEPLEIPDLLLRLRQPGDGLRVLMHDWFPVSPSYTLLDASGRYRGPVGAGDDDPAHRAGRAALAEWQAAWGRLMEAADTVILFSEAGRPILERAFPGLDPARVQVRPHALPDPETFRVLDPPRAATPEAAVLGVLGNVNHHKGADVLDALSAEGARIVVLGEVDPARPLRRAITVHGGYAPSEIPALVRRHGITHWIVPSIWPETFSFVTHEALATGLPVLGFDIGAQGWALRAAQNGHPVPFGEDPARDLRAALAQLQEVPACAG